jgi:hypothetical protein
MSPAILAACTKAAAIHETNENDVAIGAIGAQVETDRGLAFSYTTPLGVTRSLLRPCQGSVLGESTATTMLVPDVTARSFTGGAHGRESFHLRQCYL